MELTARKENRRQRLLRLVEQRFNGNQTVLALQVGVSASLISRYATATKGIGEDMRDRIEKSLGLPAGWMDWPNEGAPGGDVWQRR